MEHLVRVLNERDRRTLAWIRERVSDSALADAISRCGPTKPYISSVCRQLGLIPPVFRGSAHLPTATGERSLAHIRRILARRGTVPPQERYQQQSLALF
ncbi:MAG TPA: hypothetical protein VGM85_00940 [Paraburkholderia sp.]|jgi:hypothetical protein